MKCPRCRKHRIRTKETQPHGFTFKALKVKYCIGCGWEKTIKPKEPYYDYSLPPCPDNCPVCIENAPVTAQEGCQGVQGKVEVESLPVEASEAIPEPVTGTEPEKNGFLSKITGIFTK